MIPTIAFHKEHSDLMVSLDGATFDLTDAVEIKTGNAKNKEMASRQKVPDHHYAQLQHQMLVTGLQKMWYCFYDETIIWTGLGETKKVDAYYFTVGRDEDYIARLLTKELEFAEYLKGDLPPPLDESDHMVVVADSFLLPTIQKWIEVADEIKELKSYEKILKDAIVAQGDDSNLLFTDEIGTPLIKLSRAGRVGNIDYKRLLEDKGITEEELEQYRKPQIGWYTVERA
jgi:predicted phage-related endonuclease